MEFSLDSILEKVNDFLISNEICLSNFMDVEIYNGSGFQDIYEFLSDSEEK